MKGVIFSKFFEKLGPEAVAWLPDLSAQKRTTISLKSINILAGEHGKVSKSLAMIPFPSLNLKGLIKNIEIVDSTQRGGLVDSSLTLLFDEADDLIFYKYINTFESIFNATAARIKDLQEANKPTQDVYQELELFKKKITEALTDLQNSELKKQEIEAFPALKDEETSDLKSYKFKIIVCGDSEVGKTSLVLRFTDKAFRRTYIPTLGVNLSEKSIQYENFIVEFIIWDIAGQAKFQTMRKHFYSGADGQILVYDLTRPETVQGLKKWYQDIKSNLGFDVDGLILGNKNDLTKERKVKPENISKFAEQINLATLETSALTGANVDDAFYQIGKLLVQQKIQGNSNSSQ